MSARDSRRFAVGQWYAILGEQATILLPPQARSRVAALWELADAGAGFDELLDGLLAAGLRELSDFALAGPSDGDTRVLVRGSARAVATTADGDRVVEATPGTTWAEQLLPGVTGLVLEGEHGGGDADLPAAPGVFRASRVTYAAAQAPSPPAPVEGALAEVAAERPEAPVAEPAPEPVPAAQAAPVDQPEPVAVADPAAPARSTPSAPPVTAAAAAPSAALMELGDGQQDDEAPTGEQEPLPAAPSGDDTRVGGPHEEHVRPQAGIPGQQQAPAITSRPVARLVLSTGDVLEVDRAIVVGRAPEARQFGAQDQPLLLTVPSPHHEISSTHLEIRPGSGADHGMAVVTDLGSTNGTVLVQPGLPPEDLQPGIAVALIPGAILDLGDGVTVQVTNP
ncbi:hypothetical protein DDE18_03230 [Nocardioides gansuensis]|uniref:FHA domain-containing protein n=1 Tax=Nocardioides gansuensis TaxID=2138300 RepID=A0A2T8FFX7_9ACTN|nr:FHA domain-containing protein [Nocardioides gansuensis]PVG84628.1 hypothetical protein DDE18_03230 [Nocardioides gansuensis]